MKKSSIFVKIAGTILIILSLFFIVSTIRKIDFTFLIKQVDISFIGILFPLALFYGGIFVLLAFNYTIIINSLHKEDKLNLGIIPSYLHSNIGKYLPANIFHFAGRQLLLHNMGYKNNKIFTATVIEFMFLIFLSLILLATGLISGFISIPLKIIEIISQNWLLFIVAVGILIPGITLLTILFGLKKIKSFMISIISSFSLHTLLLLILSYSLFFLFTGTILYFILLHFTGNPFTFFNLFHAILSFTICWQIGFISPGVPGGIGVREALLLLFLTPLYGETGALYAGIVLRLITVSGDIIAFLYAILINKIITNNRVKVC